MTTSSGFRLRSRMLQPAQPATHSLPARRSAEKMLAALAAVLALTIRENVLDKDRIHYVVHRVTLVASANRDSDKAPPKQTRTKLRANPINVAGHTIVHGLTCRCPRFET
jgi:hypothetical protein